MRMPMTQHHDDDEDEDDGFYQIRLVINAPEVKEPLYLNLTYPARNRGP